MLCSVCYGVLRGHQGSQWRGTFDLHFDHQVDEAGLRNSAAAPVKCCICRSLLNELPAVKRHDRKQQNKRVKALRRLYKFFDRWFWGGRAQLNTAEETNQAAFISAYLSELPELEHITSRPGTLSNKIYRLDFKLRDSERIGTFVLDQIGETSTTSCATSTDSNVQEIDRAACFIHRFLRTHRLMRFLKWQKV